MKKFTCVAMAMAVVLALTVTAQADSLGGRSVRTVVIPGNSTDTWTVTFVAGERASVAIVGDGDTDLDLYVFDEFGNRITWSDGPTDREACTWVPRRTGPFKIKVVNRSRTIANRYAIAWN